jgi:tripeptide aminopeptidase
MNQVFQNQLIRIFLELVRIGSPTGRVERFQNHLKKELKKRNLKGKLDRFGNLVFKTKKFDAKKALLLTTHLDTVSPGENIKPKIKGSFITSDGTTILGADPKSGIAAILFVLDFFRNQKKELKNLEFIFSTNEEAGDHTLNYAQPESKLSLVLDNAAPINEAIAQGPFAKVFLIKVLGKEVYAQMDYPKGANAITALTQIISRLPWGFYQKGCIANTGIITGGTATTMVPKSAELKGNIYCFKEKDVTTFLKKIKKEAHLADQKFKTKTKVEILETYTGTNAGPKSPFVQKIVVAYQKNGIKLKLQKKLLISSNNCLEEKEIKSLNLGLGYTGCHTTKEKLNISQFSKFTKILLDIITSDHLA